MSLTSQVFLVQIVLPSPIYLVYFQCTQIYLHNFSWWTFLSNLPKAEISYHLQYVLSHKDTAQCLEVVEFDPDCFHHHQLTAHTA
nr:hypothetical protein Iba_chr04fCG9100 [Ipomoea batatas]